MSMFTLLRHEVHLVQHAMLRYQIILSEVLHPTACSQHKLLSR